MKPYARSERIGSKIQYEISNLLKKKLSDPRMEMATISHVKVSDDLRVAFVYIAVFGDKYKIKNALEGFKKSKGFIKKSIAPKLGFKYMPDLRFVHDESFDKGAKMDELIRSVTRDDTD